MQQIDATKRYEIGRLKLSSLDNPEQGEWLHTPSVFTGEQLQRMGINTWNEFFENAPSGLQLGRLYHIYQWQKDNDSKKLVAHGTITKFKGINSNGLSDDILNVFSKGNNEAPHNIKFFKDQINELNLEIKRLNLKIDDQQKELLIAKEKQVNAEQELSKHIGLNDAIATKEQEYINAIEKVQKEQQDSSNRILENLMMMAQQGMQLWMQSQQNKNNTNNLNNIDNNQISDSSQNINNLKEGDIIQIKNNQNQIENWTVKIMGDKKVIVSPTGKMKAF
jgi:hypothetical protein